MQNDNLPVAILGGGPVGLAAAAHLSKRRIPFLLFEQGDEIGHNVLSWGHVQLFSPWRYNIDKVAREFLAQSDWVEPNPEDLPTGRELVMNYLQPLANLPRIRPYVHLDAEVLSIGRKGLDKMKTHGRETRPFSIQVLEKGIMKYFDAKAIIDATGTWGHPNPIGSGGLYAAGELNLQDHIHYGIPDVKATHLDRYKNKNVVVVGGGHSAINTLLDLANLHCKYPNTRLSWILRKSSLTAVYGGKENDALKARGTLGLRIEQFVNSGGLTVYSPFHIIELDKQSEGIRITGYQGDSIMTIDHIDEIIANTGSRPNLAMVREVRTNIDSSLESVSGLAELIDPNVHSCGTVRPHGERELRQPEQDFYIVGAKSYGRAPTFLMTTGYEQVRSIIAYLAGDRHAAEQVLLDLPETGVCSSQRTKVEAGVDSAHATGLETGGLISEVAPCCVVSCCD